MPVSAPIITSNGGGATAAISLQEGITQVTTVAATDADAGTVITYRIVGGKDAFKFQIDAATGALSFKAVPDFETPTDSTVDAANVANGLNTYEVIVEANDSKAGLPVQSDQQIITVTIGDVTAVTINGSNGATAGNDLLGGLAATSEGDTISGLDGNDTIDGAGGADTMIGGKNNDVYIVDNAGDVATEVSGEGIADEVRSSVTYSMAVNASEVERLVLTGTANISGTGNALDNRITGNDVNNTIDGGAGADDMTGGKGNDIYKVDNSGDAVTEGLTEGTDRVESSVTFTLGANIENLTLLDLGVVATNINGTGNGQANTINGSSGNNIIEGKGGNDILDGKAGADTMLGGGGNDRYTVDNAGDFASELGGTGKDTVYSSVSFTLDTDVENLNLTAAGNLSGTGNAGNNIINGFSDDNTLTGGDGNDILDGKLGNDTMVGGNGSDKFYVNVAGDQVNEGAGLVGDIDTVYAAVSYDISGSTSTTGANIENVTLTVTAASVIGNVLNNVLIGNASANSISGGGGNDVLDGKAGVDSLDGGEGDDTYIVENGGDTATESTSGVAGGVDLVKSSVAFTLGANVENLTLTGFGNINGTGNSGNNELTGNSAKNVLTGGDGSDLLDGKAGADTMIGGNGNDFYYIDNAGDVASEVGGSGTDMIITKFTTTLDSDFEELTLLGTSVINGTGSASNNTINGNNGANILTGLGGADSIIGNGGADTIIGGAGQDTMTGGTGIDKFVFSELTDSTNSGLTADLIMDFSDADILDVSGIDATGSTTPLTNEAFNLINSTAANLGEGNLAWSISGGVATIKLFTDNDLGTDANMVITMTLTSNQTSLDFGDFIL